MELLTYYVNVNRFVIHALENADIPETREQERFMNLASKIRKESVEYDTVILSVDETETLLEALLREIQKTQL